MRVTYFIIFSTIGIAAAPAWADASSDKQSFDKIVIFNRHVSDMTGTQAEKYRAALKWAQICIPSTSAELEKATHLSIHEFIEKRKLTVSQFVDGITDVCWKLADKSSIDAVVWTHMKAEYLPYVIEIGLRKASAK
ncbi:hypothetical protein FJ420_30670 [Mesorhizobium sp. B3-1-3]|uniref:hypothetical protein n=1 Tax=unclassified Mesorhizobium TaxID=325217 RepID=UPI001126954F|nr:MULTISPECIES: hypothetical protein [unclassified Mesorhizobium]TPI54198.1 hypothetical protein FJ424_31380 [Mesorhizobium sp. B3-1-8]TPI61440.1 hypothetical protein FJ420_30670 [Mesorhizobium sp. B3-1-3]